MLAWIKALPGPVAAIGETGPTGYGLARTLQGSDTRTVVSAASKLQRPSGSRVKTDALDAEHLLDPSPIGRVHRSDLMRSRH
ncbi:hypothetical protein JOE56_000420 [Brevibacterium paucivorans]|uniref:Transposase IS111A/IS1328/IS1533 N-terminal domain-containing protein n=1 Tax=Brevibacterium paucivorans TaxID=170994 RepID=A0ABS2SL16_9MICO|nr:hypothetical protein [Brevibacterium paucivorans]